MKIYKTMANGVQLVEYDDSIAGAIADMWNKSGDSWGGDSGIQTAEQVIATHSSGAFFNVFVALHNDEVVGYCSFDRYYKDADTAYVHLLNVRPDFHGYKIGKELVLLCVQRTIELGYPRLDIHTWAGNTKAVPLYKKCGFLWEDRTDTTHLSNFVPTVLKTELFSDFFKDADWYDDSSRVIEIKPDGIKVNKFEVYGYSWTKNGKNLAVGFEKTGRRIRYVETDDYKIEFIGENHELAFGLNYKCTFKVENKSGKDLNIKIAGKDDDVIKFNFNAEDNVARSAEFNAEFYVGEIAEELDTWRMHPCVLADVYVNGKHAEFGIGIEPKFPLEVRFIEKRGIARQGLTEDVYINVKSFLLQNASVTFSIPENAMTQFSENKFSAETEPNSTRMIAVKAEILKCGYEKLDITYNITLADGSKTSFKKPLHLINHGIDGMYKFETDTEYCAVNGLWKLSLDKRNNFTSFYRITHGGYARFPISKLGKPYDDEFNLAKPSNVKIYNKIGEYGEALMIFEASYESSKFAGIVMTQISEFNASGVISHRHEVKNNSQKPAQLYLSENLWSNIARRAVFHYDGSIRELVDDTAYGIDDIHSEKIDENWIFDNSPNNPAGIYWAKEYHPHTRWTDELLFEHNTGELLPGETFETKPVVPCKVQKCIKKYIIQK